MFSVLALVFLVSILCLPRPVYAVNWLSGWSYRKSHSLAQIAGASTNYQVGIKVYYGAGSDGTETINGVVYGKVYMDSKCNTSFQDIRFTDNDGSTPLDIAEVEIVSSNYAIFWVEVADDLGAGAAVIYVYYGNSGVSSASNWGNTFILSDDFEDNDWTQWDQQAGIPTNSTTYVRHGTYGYMGGTGLSYIWDNLDSSLSNVAFHLWYYDQQAAGTEQHTVNGGGTSVFQLYIFETAYANYTLRAVSSYYDVKPRSTGWHECMVTDSGSVKRMYVDGTQASGTGASGITDIVLGAQWAGNAVVSYYDVFFMRQFGSGESATHGAWGAETTPNTAPVNIGASITDMEDSNNLYAQRQFYSFFANVSDADGWEDLLTVAFYLKQGAAVWVGVVWYQSTDTYALLLNDTQWEIDSGSCVSNNISLTVVEITWKVKPKWGAVEQADLEVVVVTTDDSSNSDTDTFQTNYVDVVTSLTVSGLACDDDRGELSQSITFTGTAYYVDDPSSSNPTTFYPPNAEFTSIHIYDSANNDKGFDLTVINGAFSVTITASSSMGIETYNPFINMADADYVDAEDSHTDTFITDTLVVYSLQTVSYLGSGAYQYTARVKYEYDSVDINGAYVNVSLPSGTVITQLTSNSSGWFTVVLGQSNATTSGTYTFFGVNDNGYGVTTPSANQTFILNDWELNSQDISGNNMTLTTVTVSVGATTIYSGVDDTVRFPQDTYNVSVVWKSLTVNSTSNVVISGDTSTNFNCTAYPYVKDAIRYWVASNATISTVSFSSDRLIITFSGAVTTYLLRASCTVQPAYILNATFNMATDWSGDLSLTHYANTTITVSYTAWSSGVYTYQSDQLLTAQPSWAGEIVTYTATGTTGAVGTLKIHCGTKGAPDNYQGFTTTTYSSSIFTGTYTFSSDKTLTVGWYSSGSIGETIGGADVSFAGAFSASLSVVLPPKMKAGTVINGTLTVYWTGVNVIYVYDVLFNQEANLTWVRLDEGLPIKMTKYQAAEKGEGILNIEVTLPEDTLPGVYTVPCEVTVINDRNQEVVVVGYLEFTVEGSSYNVPETMTIAFLSVIAIFIVMIAVRKPKP